MKNEREHRKGAARRFGLGDEICALADIGNEGTYPHKEIGEIIVHRGDKGFILETARFLGEVYYTVEFVDRAAVAALRAREMASLATLGSEAGPRSRGRASRTAWEARALG